jgi:hypothetical protein
VVDLAISSRGDLEVELLKDCVDAFRTRREEVEENLRAESGDLGVWRRVGWGSTPDGVDAVSPVEPVEVAECNFLPGVGVFVLAEGLKSFFVGVLGAKVSDMANMRAQIRLAWRTKQMAR